MSPKTNTADIISALGAFFISLGIAWKFNWGTPDLVWSLWLSSLVIGYLTILTTILGGTIIGLAVIHQEGFPKKHRLTAIIIGSAIALFLIGFFSVHFCGFHAGHAIFLNGFFPLGNIDNGELGSAFMNPIKLWSIVFEKIAPLYGVFLISIFIAEGNKLLNPILSAYKTIKGFSSHTDNKSQLKEKLNRKGMKNIFSGPYVNVIKMHLLIFIFVGASMANFDSFGLYTVVFVFYFFPWRLLKRQSA